MTPIELRDRLIEEGLESIGKDHDLQEHEREGSRLGFEMCRYLETLWEYEELLATAGASRSAWRRGLRHGSLLAAPLCFPPGPVHL